jgi:hypothetical protein
VDWASDNYVTRREFTKFLVLTSGALCAGNGYLALKRVQSHAVKTGPVLVAGTNDLEIGGVKLFPFPIADGIIQLIHAGEIKGLLSICFNPVVSLPSSRRPWRRSRCWRRKHSRQGRR